MLILGITVKFIMVISTVIVCFGCVYAVRYLIRLKNRLNTSIILIPLYKSKVSLIVGGFIVLALIITDIVYLTSKPQDIYLPINILIMLIFVQGLFIALIMQRFAVIDSGIIAPYRYIDWIQFSDYEIEGNTVYFTGDKYGFSSLSSTTMRMYFNSSDLNKLKLVLSRIKKK